LSARARTINTIKIALVTINVAALSFISPSPLKKF
jgi:hypothetical protein